jgi:hypothetical protein
MDYTEWLEREFFNFLETDGLVRVEEDYESDNFENAWEKEFQEWRKYRKEQFITFVKGWNDVHGKQNKEKTDDNRQ